MKKATIGPHIVFCWLGMSICYLPSNSVFLQMYINNCVHTMFKIWYMILYYLLLRAVRIMQSFIYEKILQENYNYYPDRSFLKGIEENPALVLSNVHSRTSATDGPSFGSMGLSMNTTSLFRPSLYCVSWCFHWVSNLRSKPKSFVHY